MATVRPTGAARTRTSSRASPSPARTTSSRTRPPRWVLTSCRCRRRRRPRSRRSPTRSSSPPTIRLPPKPLSTRARASTSICTAPPDASNAVNFVLRAGER
ncbi:uncharacterized protein RHOBADRAFT_66075, partial [Rhodotorula graminis WP1]